MLLKFSFQQFILKNVRLKKQTIMKNWTLLFSFCILGFAFGQKLDTLNYEVDGKPFRGYVVKPEKTTKNTQTVLLVHEWWGLNEYPKVRAKQLAKDGFIAICLDMYGADIVVDNPTDAGKLAVEVYADPNILNKRFQAGYTAAMKVKGVNSERVAAIGYCFGGTVVLNAAKMGANLDAVVSFHGGLQGPKLEKGKLKASVLVCNGAADSFVPQADIDQLDMEMKANQADYTFINYADATHAFTNPFSTEVGKKFGIPIAFNESADMKSYADFLDFMKKKVK